MLTFKKIGEALLIAGIVFLFILLTFNDRIQTPVFLKVAGRMHPMFLHFPIVLLLLSFLSLWIPSHEQAVWNWFDGLRLFAAISAVITAVMGLLLSLEQQEITRLLNWHKWGGVSIAFTAIIFYLLSNFFITHKLSGKLFTIFAGVLVLLTGHWGAGLTHGDNYLLEPIAKDRKIALEDAVVFNDIIKPILEKKCLSCHREANMKGGLLMENIDGILKGGKTGPLLVAGRPEMSLLIYRIHLPLNEKKHMPPASKPALTDDEAGLLYAWIKSGALLKQKLITLPVQDSFRMMATRTLTIGDETTAEQQYDFPPADNKIVAALNNHYRVIKPLGYNAAALAVNFYGMSNFSSTALKELLPLKQQVTELSVARMPVKNEDLSFIGQFVNLNKLNLNYTDISADGLRHLKPLQKLQVLSLSGTRINAAGIQQLDSLSSLSKLFVWDTPIDSVQEVVLQRKHSKWKIERGFAEDKDVKIALSAPTFRVPGGVIEKPKTVELKHPIRGVEIRYTIDGSSPDSINSAMYKKPFFIDSTVTIKARAFREGWFGSSEAVATYIMRTLKADSMELVAPADVKYPLRSADQLADGDLGETNYNNGQWVGYQKNDAVILLYFNSATKVSDVLVNILRNTGAHIFPPVRIEVWGGITKDQMKLLATKKPLVPVKADPAKVMQEQIRFPAVEVRCLKIRLEKLKSLPSWHESKGKPAWVMLSEIVLN